MIATVATSRTSENPCVVSASLHRSGALSNRSDGYSHRSSRAAGDDEAFNPHSSNALGTDVAPLEDRTRRHRDRVARLHNEDPRFGICEGERENAFEYVRED